MEEHDKLKEAEKLFQKMNEITKLHNAIYPREIKKAENDFKKGHRGESFLNLTQILEYQLRFIWSFYLADTTEEVKPIRKSSGLRKYTQRLWEVGRITTIQKKNLLDFQKGRNVIVHFTSEHLQKGHPSDEPIEEQFKKGIIVAREFSDRLKFPEFKFESKIFQHKTK